MDKREPDYPAAHSMDTEWYAVDADGHVGVFSSGEEGAVPESAGTDHEIPRDLKDALPESPFRLMDWLGEDRQEHHIELPSRERKKGLGRTLMFLVSLDPVRDKLDRYQVQYAPASEGVAVLFHNLPVETAWTLHESGACFGCFPWFPDKDYYDLSDDRPRRLGLFQYDHHDPGLAGPYERGQAPDQPIKVDQIPPDLRALVSRLRLAEVRFAEAEKIQPAGLVPCSSWGDAYLDLDGVTVRPVPGREADFDVEAWSNVPGLRVEAPPNPGPRRRRRR
jgi:hypothetical protein